MAEARKDHSDPLWDTRRKRLDLWMSVDFAVIVASMWMGPEIAGVIAPPGFIFAGLVLGAYFGIAGWERIQSATVVTQETIQGIAPAGQKTEKIETKLDPGDKLPERPPGYDDDAKG